MKCENCGCSNPKDAGSCCECGSTLGGTLKAGKPKTKKRVGRVAARPGARRSASRARVSAR